MRISFGLSAANRLALGNSPTKRADANNERRLNTVMTTSNLLSARKLLGSNRRYVYSIESRIEAVNEKLFAELWRNDRICFHTGHSRMFPLAPPCSGPAELRP